MKPRHFNECRGFTGFKNNASFKSKANFKKQIDFKKDQLRRHSSLLNCRCSSLSVCRCSPFKVPLKFTFGLTALSIVFNYVPCQSWNCLLSRSFRIIRLNRYLQHRFQNCRHRSCHPWTIRRRSLQNDSAESLLTMPLRALWKKRRIPPLTAARSALFCEWRRHCLWCRFSPPQNS